eukprot:Seg13413.1 transcript_id=Seg13413.1/GoldUCD/mRNA.D3Y31 product="hypothetical protein" protein_id=Seg13413.1/GoldUCD/D3Y31
MIEAAERKLKAMAVGNSGSSPGPGDEDGHDGPTFGATSTSATTFTAGTDCTRRAVLIYTSGSRTPNYIFDNPRRISSERKRPKPYVRKKRKGKGCVIRRML